MMNIPPSLGDALLNSASITIIATDYDGRITFWNPGAERCSALQPRRRLVGRWI